VQSLAVGASSIAPTPTVLTHGHTDSVFCTFGYSVALSGSQRSPQPVGLCPVVTPSPLPPSPAPATMSPADRPAPKAGAPNSHEARLAGLRLVDSHGLATKAFALRFQMSYAQAHYSIVNDCGINDVG